MVVVLTGLAAAAPRQEVGLFGGRSLGIYT